MRGKSFGSAENEANYNFTEPYKALPPASMNQLAKLLEDFNGSLGDNQTVIGRINLREKCAGVKGVKSNPLTTSANHHHLTKLA